MNKDTDRPSGDRSETAIPAFCRPRPPDEVAQQLERYRYRINLHQTLEALRAVGATAVTVDVIGWGRALKVEAVRYEPSRVDGHAHTTVCVLTEPETAQGEIVSTYPKRDLTLSQAAAEVVVQYGALTERAGGDSADIRSSVRIVATDENPTRARLAVH